MQHTFKLSDSFVDSYRSKKVSWGFTDGGGNSLGELTFLRTYSRVKDDGTKETWVDVCRRVIEGMFTIQKEHCHHNSLPFNAPKAHATAKDAFDRLWSLKWTPPGRGLWAMGSTMVMEERDSSSLQNCFSGDTEILTEKGPAPLQGLEGKTLLTLGSSGWEQSTVRSFGVQPLQEVTFAPVGIRSSFKHTVKVTPDHEWVLSSGTRTTSLSVGDRVPSVLLLRSKSSEYWDGYVHGMIFGDGVKITHMYANGDFGFELRACCTKMKGALKNPHISSRFDKVSTTRPSANGDPILTKRSPQNLKEFPSGGSGDYTYGFIDGWCLADSHKVGETTKLTSQHPEAEAWLRKMVTYAGYALIGIHQHSGPTNFGERKTPLKVFSLSTRAYAWKVTSIKDLGEEPVYCATTVNTRTFTLGNGLLTGNCMYIDTYNPKDPSAPFCMLMDASMCGVGVGFDLSAAGTPIFGYDLDDVTFVIPDSREGWVESVRLLLDGYFKGTPVPVFDYSLIRAKGEPLKRFGGVAPGPQPLKDLHSKLHALLSGKDVLDTVTVADIGNVIGQCVVAGNLRRSAEIILGDLEDDSFLNLKNQERFPERNDWQTGWAWMSNNSVRIDLEDTPKLDAVVGGIRRNGEPGVIWMDIAKNYGRLVDPPDYKDAKARGVNPCSEQILESYEACTLCETYISRHVDLEDYKKTLKVAYLYAKTVTLVPTHWGETNAIMQRNRRIGTSMSGITDFVDHRGYSELRNWMDEGYKTLKHYDEVYSSWLGVRESIRVSTVKPSGTVSILSGCSPGVHWPTGSGYYYRLVRFSTLNPTVELFRNAGYRVEPANEDPDNTAIIYFPIKSESKRAEKDVSIFEKAHLAAFAQRWWSDNGVSVTLTFNSETEGEYIGNILGMFSGQFKAVSFLPMGNMSYPQMPYTQITEEEYLEACSKIQVVDLGVLYNPKYAVDAVGERGCTTDICEIRPPSS